MCLLFNPRDGLKPIPNSPYHTNVVSQYLQDAANITNELQSLINMHVEDLIKVPIFDAAVVIAPQILISLADTTALKNALSYALF